MGYVFILVIGALALLVIVIAAMRGSRRTGGRTLGGNDVTPRRPASDEPTPGASATESPAQVRAAQKHVPPA